MLEPKTKVCNDCGLEYDIEDFYLVYYKQRGKRYRLGHCRYCDNRRHRADYMDKDAFDQFTEIAEIVGITPTQAMFVYMHKHVKALQSAMKNKALQGEALEEKLKDIINYAAMMIVYERGQDRVGGQLKDAR